MSRSPTRDFIVGLFVLAGFGALAYLSISIGGLRYNGAGGLTLFARFDETGGLKARSPVVISGVKVGQVKAITLSDDFRARVEIDVDRRLALSVDTTASIVTAGVLGDRYITLEIGGEEETLKPGDEIGFTENAVILERLIGKFIHNTGIQKPEDGEGEKGK